MSKQSKSEASAESQGGAANRAACPACGGSLMEIRGKLQCERCRTICETCCEGGPPTR